MRWSERQLAMLREMGIRVWARELPSGAAEEGGAIGVAERTAAAAPVPPPQARAPAPAYAPRPAAPVLQAVAPTGPASIADLVGADWLVVGEPFASAAAGAPEAAAAEQELLLDNMLLAIRISRRAPGREGRACHLPIEAGRVDGLAAAIEAVRPRGILALGRVAAATLLGGDEPLGKLRDRVHAHAGIPVVVTFALPYLLRHPADKARAWADLCRAVAAIA